jgi:hypothetical protein
MDKAMWDKLAAAGGVVGVVLFVIAGIVIGKMPETDDPASGVTGFFQDNRDQMLWGIFIQGLGVLAVIWFVAALGATMRNAGEGRLASALQIAFAITFAIGGMAAISRGALAFSVADDGDPQTVQSLYQTAGYMDTVSGVLGSGIFLALAGAVLRTRFLVSWWGWVSAAAGLWAIVSSTAWNRDGLWSPDQAGFVTFIVFLVWTAGTSILLTLKMREAPAARPAPTV